MPPIPGREVEQTVIGGCTLVRGDCLEILDALPWHSVDLVVTDPPYGISYKTNYRVVSNTPDVISNDFNLDSMEQIIQLVSSKLELSGAVYCFCSPVNIDDVLASFKRSTLQVKNLLIWDKTNWGAGDLYGSYGSSYEMIVFAVKGQHTLKRRGADIFRVPRVSVKRRLHQNQKPVKLLRRLIKNSTDAGALVIDPFMGSASTGEACLRTGRRFWGCELDPKFYQTAVNRIQKLQPVNKTALPIQIGRALLGGNGQS